MKEAGCHKELYIKAGSHDMIFGSLYRRTHSLSRLAWSWVGGRLALFYIHQINRVNSRNGSAMMTAP